MAPSRGRSDSPDLERLAHLIHVPLFSHQTWIYGEWIPRKSNWSGLISRLGDVDPWSAGMGCLVYTSAWWQWGAPALATGAQQSKHEEKVMPQVTSRTIKKEFKSSQKTKRKKADCRKEPPPFPLRRAKFLSSRPPFCQLYLILGVVLLGVRPTRRDRTRLFGIDTGSTSISLPLDGRVLPRFTAQAIRRVAKEAVTKAGGPDGLTPQMIVWLPDEPLSRLADILNLCEKQNRCPSDLSHWKVAVIPKKRKGKLASVGDVRPAAVGALVYRLWARRLGFNCRQFATFCPPVS